MGDGFRLINFGSWISQFLGMSYIKMRRWQGLRSHGTRYRACGKTWDIWCPMFRLFRKQNLNVPEAFNDLSDAFDALFCRQVDSPAFWTVRDWCIGFRRLLDHLQLDLVHIFGSSLGGFLAQKFAEMTNKNPRVKSLLLCNTFNDTSIFGFTNTAAT